MDFRIASVILLLHISGSLTLNRISVTCENICALRETNVQLKCSYDDTNIKTVFWFIEKQSTNWRKNNEPEDLTLDSDYSGRVKQIIGKYEAELTIADVRERDSGEYQLMFIMKDGVKHLSSAAIILTVTDLILQVRMNPASTDQRNETVELICETSCDLTSIPKNYYWKKNGQYEKSLSHSRSIEVSLEAAASYSCFLTIDLMNSSSPVCISKSGCWDVTYTSRRVCALVGSTVDISCTYSHPSGSTVYNTFWHYVQPGGFKDLREDQDFAGRVEYVGNKLRVKELKISDSGEYRFRFITDLDQYSGSPGVIFTVTDTQVKSSLSVVSEGQEVILSCSTKCTLNNKHTYIWYKNGRQVTNGFTKANKLYLDSASNEELHQYSCAVEEIESNTVLLSTVIILSVFLILALIGVLWYSLNRRRKTNSPQQHEDNKGSVQSGSAALYDNAVALSTVCTQEVHIKDQDVHYSTINFKQSHTKNIASVPTAVNSTTDDVHYAAVKFS
ncbi:sialoadhesin-like [Sinocyclocheilus anshuiensis]|uniref:sialoadhesin-like n=1 Tax=Sinocyclocheilus anshuiensis TaxID=1608454 RepID=UPI0007B800A2|nr:PREDICTED: sialoadhesin-like [Sinocyclocheilus anshuiensis]